MGPIIIDGSRGEGGGQVLRTALALSAVTGRPFAIERIRARRERPGLQRQHLTAVEAVAALCRAEVEGASLGSGTLLFRPREVVPGEYHFAVGTAGSACLVLQAVLPPLLTAAAPSALTVDGGTHNPMAPPFDFLARAFLPLVGRMGPRVSASLERPGFYPAGGGRFTVRVDPAPRLSRLELFERGPVVRRRGRVLLSRLPRHVAEREVRALVERLGWEATAFDVDVVEAAGPGNAVSLEVGSAHVTEVFSGIGERGVPAERVAATAADEALAYLGAGVPVWTHLADQVLLPMALAGGGAFRTGPVTRHFTTNAEVIGWFLEAPIRTREEPGGAVRVEVG